MFSGIGLNRTKKRKVIVTGTGRSGKTVFLVSLINHIKNFRPDDDFGLEILAGKERIGFRRFVPKSDPVDNSTFPYHRYRERLSLNHQWPRKTRDMTEYRCAFQQFEQRRPKRSQNVDLTLIDIPGERVADLPMIEHKTFDNWSDARVQLIEDKTDHLEHARASGFWSALEKAGKGEANADDLVTTYKRFLLRCACSYVRSISPSTFLLDQEGQTADFDAENCEKEEAVNALLARRFSGLKGKEFVPLSADARKASKKTASAFRKGFDAYQKEILSPLQAKVKDADSLVVLIDIPDILVSGYSIYNETLRFLDSLASIVTRKRFGFLSPKISKAVFFASKADTVRRSDLGHLKDLIDDVVHTSRDQLESENVECWVGTCSAVVCTGEIATGAGGGKDDDRLCGFAVLDADGEYIDYPKDEIIEAMQNREEGKPWGRPVSVSPLPARWATHWKPESYAFPEFYPVVPARENQPPRHMGMSEIVKFLLELG
jgi:predicted YcjX-like family ATPase